MFLIYDMENDLFKYIYTKYLEKANETIFFTIEEWIDNMLKSGKDVTGGIIGLNIDSPKENLFTNIGGIKVYYRDPENINDYKHIGSYRPCEGTYLRYQLDIEYFIEELNEDEIISELIAKVKAELIGGIIRNCFYRNEKDTKGELIIVFNSYLGLHPTEEKSEIQEYKDLGIHFFVEVDNIKPETEIGKVIFHLPFFPWGTVQVFCKKQ